MNNRPSSPKKGKSSKFLAHNNKLNNQSEIKRANSPKRPSSPKFIAHTNKLNSKDKNTIIIDSPGQHLTQTKTDELVKLVVDVGLTQALQITENKRNNNNNQQIDNEKRYLIWWSGTPVITNACTKNSSIKWDY